MQPSTWQGYIFEHQQAKVFLRKLIRETAQNEGVLFSNRLEKDKEVSLTSFRQRHFPFALMRGKGSTKTFAFFLLPPCIYPYTRSGSLLACRAKTSSD